MSTPGLKGIEPESTSLERGLQRQRLRPRYTPAADVAAVAVVAPRLGATNATDALRAALAGADARAMRTRGLALAEDLVYARSGAVSDAVDAAGRGLRASRPDVFARR